MVHGGVGAHAQPQDAPGRDSGGAAQVGNDGGEGLLDDGILEALSSAGLGLLDNPVNHIGAIANLSIAGGAFGQDLSGGEIYQHHGDGGSADVNGAAGNHRVLSPCNLHAPEGIALLFPLHPHMELLPPKGGGQLFHDAEGNLHRIHFQLLLDGPGQTLVVRHGVLQGGLLHGQLQAQEGIFKDNTAFLQLLLGLLEDGHFLRGAEVGGFHPGLVGRGDIRHQHGAVPYHLAAAA